MIEATILDFEEISDGSSVHTFYNITVNDGGSITTVKRRYSEFVKLHNQLKSSHPLFANFSFPRKLITAGFSNKQKISTERKDAFNSYLQLIIESKLTAGCIFEFLGLSDGYCAQRSTKYSVEEQEQSPPEIESEDTMGKRRDFDAASNGSSSHAKVGFSRRYAAILTFFAMVYFMTVIFGTPPSPGKACLYSSTLGRYYCIVEGLQRPPVMRGAVDAKASRFSFSSLENFGSLFRTVLATVMVMSFSHRIAGFLLGAVVRHKLCKVNGSYQVEIGWCAIRLGFDRNEIVFHDIKWHNPPMFRETPYFCSIEEVTLRFDMMSCVGALMNHEDYVARIRAIEIDNVEVYIEKLHQPKGKDRDREGDRDRGDASNRKASVNIWCALGDTEDEPSPHEDYGSKVQHYMSSIMDSVNSTIGSSSKKGMAYLSESGKAPAAASSGSQRSPTASSPTPFDTVSTPPLQESMLNIFSSKTNTSAESMSSHRKNSPGRDAADRSHDEKGLKNNAEEGGHFSIKDALGISFPTRRAASEGGACPSGKSGETSRQSANSAAVDAEDENIASSHRWETCHESQAEEQRGMEREREKKDNGDGDSAAWLNPDGQRMSTRPNSTVTSTTPPLAPSRLLTPTLDNAPTLVYEKKKKPLHLGVKYRLHVDQLSLRDIKVHAQDFLNATHCEASEAKIIKLVSLTMDSRQLNKPEEKSKLLSVGSAPQVEAMGDKKNDDKLDKICGSYADEILRRILSILQYEVITKNKLSLASHLFGAAANHTASVVRDVATSAKRGVAETVIAHNPKELFHMANRALAKTVMAQKMNPGAVSDLALTRLKVRVLLGRNFKQGSHLLEHSLVCSCRFLDPSDSTHSTSYKSHPKRPDAMSIVTWNEVITLSPVLSYDTVLHVRVFEYHLLKDSFVCELFLPLHEMLIQAAGKESVRTEEGEGEGGIQSARSTSSSSSADSGPGSSDKSPSMKSEKSSKIKSSKDAAAVDAVGVRGGVAVAVAVDGGVHCESSVRSHLGSITFENMFGNLMHSAHTAGSAKPCESERESEAESEKNPQSAPTDVERSVSGPALLQVHSSPCLGQSNSSNSDVLGAIGTVSVGGSERKSVSGGVREVIQWHPCYGRQSDNETHIAKGEIYLGLQLERES